MGDEASLNRELKDLAKLLADWSEGTSSLIYLFGSRVRGDHRADSDVDVVIRWAGDTDDDEDWWTKNNEEFFSSINARLPGPMKILENTDPPSDRVVEMSSNPKYRDRNVVCVWMPAKPSRK